MIVGNNFQLIAACNFQLFSFPTDTTKGLLHSVIAVFTKGIKRRNFVIKNHCARGQFSTLCWILTMMMKLNTYAHVAQISNRRRRILYREEDEEEQE